MVLQERIKRFAKWVRQISWIWKGSLWSFWPLVSLWSWVFFMRGSLVCLSHTRGCTCTSTFYQWCHTVPLSNRWRQHAKICCSASAKAGRRMQVSQRGCKQCWIQNTLQISWACVLSGTRHIAHTMPFWWVTLSVNKAFCLFIRKLCRAPQWKSLSFWVIYFFCFLAVN